MMIVGMSQICVNIYATCIKKHVPGSEAAQWTSSCESLI